MSRTKKSETEEPAVEAVMAEEPAVTIVQPLQEPTVYELLLRAAAKAEGAGLAVMAQRVRDIATQHRQVLEVRGV